MRIDSHHHFWDYSPEEYPWIEDSMSLLRRNFTPADLRAEIRAAGIERVVSVQARQTVAETDWLLELAEQDNMIAAVVGWVPLASVEIRSELERLASATKLRSVRHVVQDEADDDFILGKDFNRGVALLAEFDLVYDILIFGRQLRQTIEFVDRHPEQSFVLDHIAKPTIRSQEFDEAWGTDFRRLAERENVSCKFSALVTEVRDPDWNVATLQPYWDTAWEVFGPRRLMFGSDWPVCLLRSSYADWIAAVSELAAGLSRAEQADFWGGTAERAYRLPAI